MTGRSGEGYGVGWRAGAMVLVGAMMVGLFTATYCGGTNALLRDTVTVGSVHVDAHAHDHDSVHPTVEAVRPKAAASPDAVDDHDTSRHPGARRDRVTRHDRDTRPAMVPDAPGRDDSGAPHAGDAVSPRSPHGISSLGSRFREKLTTNVPTDSSNCLTTGCKLVVEGGNE